MNPQGREPDGFLDRVATSYDLRFQMVGKVGIEPTSFGFSDQRSDLVSYIPKWHRGMESDHYLLVQSQTRCHYANPVYGTG